MLSNFLYAFHAIAPILILVLIGWLLKTKHIFDSDFFKKLNKFAFHICFPPLMFCNLYALDDITQIDMKFAGYAIMTVVLLTVLAFILTQFLTSEKKRRGVMIQAGFRSNFAIIGIPLAAGMAGESGTMVTTMLQAPTIVYFNVISVLVLSIYSDSGTFNIKKVLKNLIKNPLIQGLAAGVIALLVRHYMPMNADHTYIFTISGNLPWLYTVLEYLGSAATPLCLLALGGTFEFSAISGLRKELTAAVLMRLVIAPLVGFGLFYLAVRRGMFDLTPAMTAALIALYGSPIAVSSNVMAQEMGADDVLAGQIVVWTSLFSMVTLFIMIVLFRSAGLL